MSFWSRFGRLFTVDDSIMDEDFSLLADQEQMDDSRTDNDQFMKDTDNSGGRKSANNNSVQTGNNDDPMATQQNGSRTQKLKTIKPRKLIPPTKRIPFYAVHNRSRQAPMDDQTNSTVPEKLSKDLQVNRDTVRQMFHLPTNADVIIRDFTISETVTCKAFAVFMEGMSDKEIINFHVLQPLMILSSLSPDNALAGFG